MTFFYPIKNSFVPTGAKSPLESSSADASIDITSVLAVLLNSSPVSLHLVKDVSVLGPHLNTTTTATPPLVFRKNLRSLACFLAQASPSISSTTRNSALKILKPIFSQYFCLDPTDPFHLDENLESDPSSTNASKSVSSKNKKTKTPTTTSNTIVESSSVLTNPDEISLVRLEMCWFLFAVMRFISSNTLEIQLDIYRPLFEKYWTHWNEKFAGFPFQNPQFDQDQNPKIFLSPEWIISVHQWSTMLSIKTPALVYLSIFAATSNSPSWHLRLPYPEYLAAQTTLSQFSFETLAAITQSALQIILFFSASDNNIQWYGPMLKSIIAAQPLAKQKLLAVALGHVHSIIAFKHPITPVAFNFISPKISTLVNFHSHFIFDHSPFSYDQSSNLADRLEEGYLFSSSIKSDIKNLMEGHWDISTLTLISSHLSMTSKSISTSVAKQISVAAIRIQKFVLNEIFELYFSLFSAIPNLHLSAWEKCILHAQFLNNDFSSSPTSIADISKYLQDAIPNFPVVAHLDPKLFQSYTLILNIRSQLESIGTFDISSSSSTTDSSHQEPLLEYTLGKFFSNSYSSPSLPSESMALLQARIVSILSTISPIEGSDGLESSDQQAESSDTGTSSGSTKGTTPKAPSPLASTRYNRLRFGSQPKIATKATFSKSIGSTLHHSLLFQVKPFVHRFLAGVSTNSVSFYELAKPKNASFSSLDFDLKILSEIKVPFQINNIIPHPDNPFLVAFNGQRDVRIGYFGLQGSIQNHFEIANLPTSSSMHVLKIGWVPGSNSLLTIAFRNEISVYNLKASLIAPAYSFSLPGCNIVDFCWATSHSNPILFVLSNQGIIFQQPLVVQPWQGSLLIMSTLNTPPPLDNPDSKTFSISGKLYFADKSSILIVSNSSSTVAFPFNHVSCECLPGQYLDVDPVVQIMEPNAPFETLSSDSINDMTPLHSHLLLVSESLVHLYFAIPRMNLNSSTFLYPLTETPFASSHLSTCSSGYISIFDSSALHLVALENIKNQAFLIPDSRQNLLHPFKDYSDFSIYPNIDTEQSFPFIWYPTREDLHRTDFASFVCSPEKSSSSNMIPHKFSLNLPYTSQLLRFHVSNYRKSVTPTHIAVNGTKIELSQTPRWYNFVVDRPTKPVIVEFFPNNRQCAVDNANVTLLKYWSRPWSTPLPSLPRSLPIIYEHLEHLGSADSMDGGNATLTLGTGLDAMSTHSLMTPILHDDHLFSVPVFSPEGILHCDIPSLPTVLLKSLIGHSEYLSYLSTHPKINAKLVRILLNQKDALLARDSASSVRGSPPTSQWLFFTCYCLHLFQSTISRSYLSTFDAILDTTLLKLDPKDDLLINWYRIEILFSCIPVISSKTPSLKKKLVDNVYSFALFVAQTFPLHRMDIICEIYRLPAFVHFLRLSDCDIITSQNYLTGVHILRKCILFLQQMNSLQTPRALLLDILFKTSNAPYALDYVTEFHQLLIPHPLDPIERGSATVLALHHFFCALASFVELAVSNGTTEYRDLYMIHIHISSLYRITQLSPHLWQRFCRPFVSLLLSILFTWPSLDPIKILSILKYVPPTLIYPHIPNIVHRFLIHRISSVRKTALIMLASVVSCKYASVSDDGNVSGTSGTSGSGSGSGSSTPNSLVTKSVTVPLEGEGPIPSQDTQNSTFLSADQRASVINCLTTAIHSFYTLGELLEQTISLLGTLLYQDNDPFASLRNRLIVAMLAKQVSEKYFETPASESDCIVCNRNELVSLRNLASIASKTKYLPNSITYDFAECLKFKSIKVEMNHLNYDRYIRTLEVAVKTADSQEWKIISSTSMPHFTTVLDLEYPIPVQTRSIRVTVPLIRINHHAITALPSCPTCGHAVYDPAGHCAEDGENVYQCKKCRNINYQKLDAFFCVECGHSRYVDIRFIADSVNVRPQKFEKILSTRLAHLNNGTTSSPDCQRQVIIPPCSDCIETTLGYLESLFASLWTSPNWHEFLATFAFLLERDYNDGLTPIPVDHLINSLELVSQVDPGFIPLSISVILRSLLNKERVSVDPFQSLSTVLNMIERQQQD